MKERRRGIMMLALGLALGSGATIVARPPSVAVAQPSAMQMQSHSAGDSEMNAAMDRMMQRMSALKLTGVQDRDFMLMMSLHHRSAVEMAGVELRRGSHPELKGLAQNIIKSQKQEISQMQTWLKTWYKVGS